VIEKAVERMLPKGPLGRQVFKTCVYILAQITHMKRNSQKFWTLQP